MSYQRTCIVCNSPFTAKYNKRITCSEKCYTRYKRGITASSLFRLCIVCGEEFERKYDRSRFCGKGCSQKHHRAKAAGLPYDDPSYWEDYRAKKSKLKLKNMAHYIIQKCIYCGTLYGYIFATFKPGRKPPTNHCKNAKCIKKFLSESQSLYYKTHPEQAAKKAQWQKDHPYPRNSIPRNSLSSICVVCGAEFKHSRTTRITCSKKCYYILNKDYISDRERKRLRESDVLSNRNTENGNRS